MWQHVHLLKGEYQDETGASTCKRCAIGDYQERQKGWVFLLM